MSSTKTVTQRRIQLKLKRDPLESRKEAREILQKKAREYLIADQRLEDFCQKNHTHSAVHLTHYGLAVARKRNAENPPADLEAKKIAEEVGACLHSVNNTIEAIVADGVSVFDCLEITRQILDPNGKPINNEDISSSSEDEESSEEPDEKELLEEPDED